MELKVEERAKQDKEDLRQERQSLFNKRRAEQAHMRAIQHKMELAEIVSVPLQTSSWKTVVVTAV